jgi:hypothetical protein
LLRLYEIGGYEIVRCSIYTGKNEAVPGCTIRFIGDISAVLDDAVLDCVLLSKIYYQQAEYILRSKVVNLPAGAVISYSTSLAHPPRSASCLIPFDIYNFTTSTT